MITAADTEMLRNWYADIRAARSVAVRLMCAAERVPCKTLRDAMRADAEVVLHIAALCELLLAKDAAIDAALDMPGRDQRPVLLGWSYP